MEKQLLNDGFIQYVNYQMQEFSYILDNIEDCNQYLKQLSNINEKIDKNVSEELRSLSNNISNCYENLSLYENALAFCLGMRQGFYMQELKNV